MKHRIYRIVAIAMALSLGWYFGGMVNSAPAEDHGHKTAPAATEDHGHAAASAEPHGHAAAPAAGSHDSHAADGEQHGDAAVAAAEQLRVDMGSNAGWYSNVVTAAILLFVAAVVIGVPVLKARGPEPKEDDHGHDDHGHDAHGGHGHDAHAHAPAHGGGHH